MRHISLLIALFFLNSCSEKRQEKKDFYDKALDFLIENKQEEIVEFPEIYKTLTSKIPEDKEEKLQLVEKLKLRGFRVTNWGRGNHALGPRIVIVNLKKENCECEVAKIYYSTINDSLYQVSEKISCKKASR